MKMALVWGYIVAVASVNQETPTGDAASFKAACVSSGWYGSADTIECAAARSVATYMADERNLRRYTAVATLYGERPSEGPGSPPQRSWRSR